jgi:hypothetical protein
MPSRPEAGYHEQHHKRQASMITPMAAALAVSFVELDDDEQWRDLRNVRQISRNEDHRTVFADRARKGAKALP